MAASAGRAGIARSDHRHAAGSIAY